MPGMAGITSRILRGCGSGWAGSVPFALSITLLKRQPHQAIFPLRCFRRQPDEQNIIDCRSNIETLRYQEYSRAVFSGVPEFTEVSGHRACIMRNEHALAFPL